MPSCETPDRPLLSILVLAYTRHLFVKQTLESVRHFFSGVPSSDYEVIVFNNGATDETRKATEEFRDTPSFRIIGVDQNIDFVPGLLRCISEAKGKYCWFLGDDDYLTKTPDDLMKRLETDSPDIMLLNHFFYISEGQEKKFVKYGAGDFLLKNAKKTYFGYREYLSDIEHPNAYFMHAAAQIFKRDLWNRHYSQEIADRHEAAQSIHILVLHSILRSADKIGYYSPQIAALRVGASYEGWYSEEGRYHRIMCDVVYFMEMMREIYDEPEILNKYQKMMLRHNTSVLMLGSKIKADYSMNFYRKVFRLMYEHHRRDPFFWFVIVPIILTPGILVRTAYRLFLGKT